MNIQSGSEMKCFYFVQFQQGAF